MANITLTIPDELHDKLRKHTEIRWSELMRKILFDKIHEFELMEDFVSKSKMDFDSAFEVSKIIDGFASKKLGLK